MGQMRSQAELFKALRGDRGLRLSFERGGRRVEAARYSHRGRRGFGFIILASASSPPSTAIAARVSAPHGPSFRPVGLASPTSAASLFGGRGHGRQRGPSFVRDANSDQTAVYAAGPEESAVDVDTAQSGRDGKGSLHGGHQTGFDQMAPGSQAPSVRHGR